MSYHSPPPARPREIPFGLVLIVVGALMVGIVGIILALSPVPLPLSEQVRLALVAAVPGVEQHLPGTAPAPSLPADLPILLPETPLVGALPSEASVDELLAYQPRPIDGQPTRLVVPRLALDAPVSGIGLEAVKDRGQLFYQWAVPNRFAAGWHNSSAPLGEPGNTVLNGHHNVFGSIFGELIDLQIGDEIILYDDQNQPRTYEVRRNELLLERGQPLATRVDNARWIERTDDERVTLVTCWPQTDNSHRLVVVAVPTGAAAAD